MPFRVITARLDGKPSDIPVLNGALSLSRTFNGHIDALFARPDPRISAAVISDGIYPTFYEDVVAQMEREWAKTANVALKNFESWRTEKNVRRSCEPDQVSSPSAEWREAVGTDNETVGRGGHVSDILVLAMTSRGAEFRDEAGFEIALFNTGRPVLLMPAGDHSDMTTGKVVIAWNGSPEAFHAVIAAMPILKKAEEVLIYTAIERNVTEGMAEKLASYLTWHDVPASVLPHGKGSADTAEEALLAAASKAKAGLLVMGAYTRNRVRELIFGGMTRHILNHANLPVLMAH